METIQLTKRETEIAGLLAWGMAKKEVADKLCISECTVANTTRNVFEKLEIQKTTELCVWWFVNKCGVSIKLDPLKRAAFALLMLAAILPREIMFPAQNLLMRTHARVSVRPVRTGRNKNTLEL